MFSASSGVATLRATHLSRVSSQTSGPVLPSTSTLLMKADSQTESIYLKVCVLLIFQRYQSDTFSKFTKVKFKLFSFTCPCPGGRVWAFNGYQPVRGYPKKLSSLGLPSSVRKIDAALYDVESGKTLFFVDDYYFRCVFWVFFNLRIQYELFST